MNRLFWGLFFVILDYKVKIGTAAVEIFPDFLGYFLLMREMERLAEKSPRFDRGRHVAFGMSIVSGLLFGGDLLNFDTRGQVWLWGAGMIALVIGLTLVRCVIRGLGDVGRRTENLKGMWLILAVLQILCSLFRWVPLVGDVCGIVSVATGALFLVILIKETKTPAE